MDIFVRTVALVVFVGILNRWTVHCKPEVINYSPPHPENVTQQTPPPCNSTLVCMQKIPTSYITSHVCGQAALCFWELWNYRIYKAKACNATYTIIDNHLVFGIFSLFQLSQFF